QAPVFPGVRPGPRGDEPGRGQPNAQSLRGGSARGLSLYHDHFIGEPGGVVIFYVETPEQRAALEDPGPLAGWRLEVRPLIFARSPGAFDEQITFTLKAYRSADWKHLRRVNRPQYGWSEEEAELAREV